MVGYEMDYGIIYVAFATLFLMAIGYLLHRKRYIHIPVMVAVILFDLLMPFYLYMNRDWKARLIESGDILSFMVWMHFGLVITLYGLYIVQVRLGVKMYRGEAVRDDHASLAKGILLVRLFVIMSGTMLFNPDMG